MRLLPALAALAALSLSCSATSGAAGSAPPAAQPSAQAKPATPEEALPGVDLEGLTGPAREALAAWAAETFCACGCPHTVSGCLRGHASCKHAPRMARLARGLAAKGATGPEIARIVQDYYAGFDRRARFDLTGLGAPIGNPDAKITIVVVSDFTCPFCKIFVPSIEQFARKHGDQVRLFAKPFPIASHPGAAEAAQAGEWARDAGIYWEAQQRLYAIEDAPTPDNLAAAIEEAGGDGDDLRQALAEGRYKERVARAQAEARAAGLKGTPSVYLNGRRVEELSEEGLTFALEDELEWVTHGSWIRD